MVSAQSVQKQLKQIGFKAHGWGRGEVSELHHILLPGEIVYECVNGIYDGGFALLLATDVRVLLVDKKPLNYLTVEDLRFDMINEIDYSHRLLGARISVATGNRDLKFLSYNQPRLRKLIGHVQHCMAEAKKQQSSHAEGQSQHLEKINQQLQAYLMAQHQYQQQLQQMQGQAQGQAIAPLGPPRPGHELSDYLLAQSLMAQHQAAIGADQPQSQMAWQPLPSSDASASDDSQLKELYNEGMQEIFGKRPAADSAGHASKGVEVNPMRIAYSKLPMALRNRRFGRPSFHVPGPAQNRTPAAAPEA